MPRPTGRGLGVLGLAAGTYLAGRMIGTWELYLIAFGFAAVFVISWLAVALTATRIRVTRSLVPERPVAGDQPDYTVTVKNASLLPGPQLTLRTYTETLAEEDLEAEIESLRPRGRRLLRSRITPVNRGVHSLPGIEAVAEDPFGIATASRTVGEPMAVTVYPRIAFLRSCVLHPELGLKRDWAGQKGLPTPGASEFRGIRPHQPGEPLSHIDWKSTARTGTLMIREMEEPAGSDINLLLDRTADQVVGTAPDTNFELAVRAVGSIADYALRMGRGVTLIGHDTGGRQVRFTADGGGRRLLLETLAQVKADATDPLASTVRRLLGERAAPLRSQSLTVVGMTLDLQMNRALVSLREDGVNLSFLYVPGFSFASDHGLLPFLPPHAPAPLPAETRALLLQLSSAGVRCVTLAHGDDLVQTLSVWQNLRSGGMAAR